VLAVSDDGAGIAPEFLSRIFDLFSQGERTLDRAAGGLGLGLTVVRRLVELHRGHIAAASAGVGQGATFTVRLPAIAAPKPDVEPVPAVVKERRALRILIVEDNDDSRESLQMLLRLQGHEVHAAADGPSGVEQAVALLPDFAVVDIGLPGCDGYEVARQVRAAAPDSSITLIALTGYGQEENRQQAEQAGFDTYLVKPLDVVALKKLFEEKF
jgi:CheY-like chemotaxis protein